MPRQNPITQTMKLSELKNRVSQVISEVGRQETRVLVEEAGVPVAAVVSAADLQRLNDLDRDWEERTKAITRFGQAFADLPVAEAEAQVVRIIAERRPRPAAGSDRQSA